MTNPGQSWLDLHMTPAATPTLTLEVTAMNTTVTSPLPYIPADALRGAYEWMSTVMGCVRVTFDARQFGADVDEVSVSMRDLEFIHSADPSRFGGINECPFCQAD